MLSLCIEIPIKEKGDRHLQIDGIVFNNPDWVFLDWAAAMETTADTSTDFPNFFLGGELSLCGGRLVDINFMVVLDDYLLNIQLSYLYVPLRLVVVFSSVHVIVYFAI